MHRNSIGVIPQGLQQPLLTVFDTAASSRNLGDQIIMDAVRTQLRLCAPEAFCVTIPTHDFVGKEGRALFEQSAACVVGGTNLLSSAVNKYNQWKVSWRDTLWLKNVILLGVGWWQYQGLPDFWTRMFLRRVLHHDFPHSLRDGYTLNRLGQAGFANAMNTSCVTLWEFDQERQSAIPSMRAEAVVTTLTDYKPAPADDRALLELLKARYAKVYLWLQGSRDHAYLERLEMQGIEVVGPQLSAYDDLLSSSLSLDYVGTRLHAGIRAMKHARRSIIIGVDNRAMEIGADVGLNVFQRGDAVDRLAKMIDSDLATELNLPWHNIAAWRAALRKELGLSATDPVIAPPSP